MRKICLALTLLVAAGTSARDLKAQNTDRLWKPRRVEKGLSLAFSGATTWFTAEFYRIYLPLRPGSGWSAEVGYRWNRWIQTYGALTYTEHHPRFWWLWSGTYGFLVAELKAVFPLTRWRHLRPAAVVGYGRAVLSGEQEQLLGHTILAGALVEYFLTRRVTLGAEALVRYIDYTSVEYRVPGVYLNYGTVNGSHTALLWLRLAVHLGRI
ncbi:MAG: hypothetical protein GXO73_11585 [Calditrichaeota bacterium]|nr:hypothetical protein [Calditrichota bacterium]